MAELDWGKVKKIIQCALEEDIGTGDITSMWIIGEDLQAKAVMLAKQEGITAGLDVAGAVFEMVDSRIKFTPQAADGKRMRVGDPIAEAIGPARGILAAERTALNFLQRMSGIATMTSRYVEAIQGTRAMVTDTRKTTPGLRILEKYAVRVGGGINHRFGLYDMVLIKENHIKAAGSFVKAVAKAKEKLSGSEPRDIKIKVEAESLEEVQQALSAGVDRIILDNMSIEKTKEAVNMVRNLDSRVEVEVSGGITLENVRETAQTGVDFISIGALTHSAPALDISLLIEETW